MVFRRQGHRDCAEHGGRRGKELVVCCSTDLCNEDYETGDVGDYHYDNYHYDDYSFDYHSRDNIHFVRADHAQPTVYRNQRSIPTLSSYTSSEPTPNTSSPSATSGNVTLTDISTKSGGTKDPLETIDATTLTGAAASSKPYAWIALLVVGVGGTLVCGVLFVLVFRGIICAQKQSPANDVISKELDKTLV
ncbi:hypothetical protein AAVH_31175 [Aphelenchoides avenae]|nr:hypothetical protein AAVH_31175 [Aphelenchus avenae]